MIADFWGASHVAAVDGVLNVAEHMGEADLVLLTQFLLTGIAVRDPHFWLMTTKNLLGHTARATLGDLLQHGITHCHGMMPLVRMVLSSEAIIRAFTNLSPIAFVAAAVPVPMRCKVLAIAPSEMTRPNSSWAIRERRSKLTLWLWCK